MFALLLGPGRHHHRYLAVARRPGGCAGRLQGVGFEGLGCGL